MRPCGLVITSTFIKFATLKHCIMQQAGKVLIIAGIIFIIAGVIVYFVGNKFGWIGNLPGDIRIEKENVKIYIPVTTMILISIVLSLIFYLIRKLF